MFFGELKHWWAANKIKAIFKTIVSISLFVSFLIGSQGIFFYIVVMQHWTLKLTLIGFFSLWVIILLLVALGYGGICLYISWQKNKMKHRLDNYFTIASAFFSLIK